MFLLVLSAAVLMFAITPQGSPGQVPTMARLMPHGAILYLEAKDFGALLSDWNNSRVKTEWLASANYREFAQSRIFLRLQQAQAEFASAAGIPADSRFLSQAAGTNSALAVYDIGDLHFLYISRIRSSDAMQNALWQSRTKFEPRSASGHAFFVKKDAASGRVVAFALADDYLLLATQEELLAGALDVVYAGNGPSLADERWFSSATGAAGEPGDLRLVLNLPEIVKTPHFRSYWIQRNVTELHQYSAAISDLYRERGGFREERVLLKDGDATANQASQTQLAGRFAASALTAGAPKDAGVYRAEANPGADQLAMLISEKLLSPARAVAESAEIAPAVPVADGETGNAQDLETRIDEPLHLAPKRVDALADLRAALAGASPNASLLVESTSADAASDFVKMNSVILLSKESNWEAEVVLNALATAIANLSASQMGLAWRRVQWPQSETYQLNGQFPLYLAIQGKYLAVTNSAELLKNISLAAATVSASASDARRLSPVTLIARISFSQERPHFLSLARTIDGANFGYGGAPEDRDNTPAARQDLPSPPPQLAPSGFLSGDVGSLIRVLRGISSESIVRRDEGSRVLETVTYEISR